MAEASISNPKGPKRFPLLGIVAVLLGASISSFFGRLLSVGAGDLRGAMHMDYDTASWISTWFNMGQMFIGPFTVYLASILGPRRVLFLGAVSFTGLTLLLPFVPHAPTFLFLTFLAGLTVGTFYPLTLAFLLRSINQMYALWAIAVYAIDIVVTVHITHSYDAWMMEHLSWRWIFWTNTTLTVLMVALIYFGVPEQPLPQAKPGEQTPSWRGFLYGSAGAALLYGALDQGIHLDWWHSPTFVAMVVSGSYLLLSAIIRHFYLPNRMVNFPFLRRWNTMVMAFLLLFFRFFLLSALLLVPTYLSSVQHYSASEIGPVLLWLAIPQVIAGVFAVYLLERIDARVILAVGIALIAAGCIENATLTSAWSGQNFFVTQLLLAIGEAITFNGLVGALILDVMNSGIMNRGIEMLTFSAFFQVVRLVGGEIGTVYMQHFLRVRTAFHASVIGSIPIGSPAANARLQGLIAGMQGNAPTTNSAIGRSATLFGLTVRQQAFTMAIGDCFWLIAFSALICLVAVACVGSLNIQYKHVLATLRAQRTS
ncbi:MAG: MFS transporter [Edaphobacter sp.]